MAETEERNPYLKMFVTGIFLTAIGYIMALIGWNVEFFELKLFFLGCGLLSLLSGLIITVIVPLFFMKEKYWNNRESP